MFHFVQNDKELVKNTFEAASSLYTTPIAPSGDRFIFFFSVVAVVFVYSTSPAELSVLLPTAS